MVTHVDYRFKFLRHLFRTNYVCVNFKLCNKLLCPSFFVTLVWPWENIYLWTCLGLRLLFETFLPFVCEWTWCKRPMEQWRCDFVMSICVNSKNGVTCCWWKSKCNKECSNMEPMWFLECGLLNWVSMFGFMKNWRLRKVVGIVQEVEIEDWSWKLGILKLSCIPMLGSLISWINHCDSFEFLVFYRYPLEMNAQGDLLLVIWFSFLQFHCTRD